jgi:hypothetical protein
MERLMTTKTPPTRMSLLDALKQIVGDAAVATLPDRPTDHLPPHMQDLARGFGAHAAVHREFCDRMATGALQGVGRRGSPTAPQSDIPAAAWRHLQVTDWQRSTLVEPDGTVWYDLSCLQAGAESVAIPSVPPEPAPIEAPEPAAALVSKGGSPDRWDWAGLKPILERQKAKRSVAFKDRRGFKDWISQNVRPLEDTGEDPPPPASSTINRAIKRHKLDELLGFSETSRKA